MPNSAILISRSGKGICFASHMTGYAAVSLDYVGNPQSPRRTSRISVVKSLLQVFAPRTKLSLEGWSLLFSWIHRYEVLHGDCGFPT